MQIIDFKFFPGKILLFGEYLVIQGEEALAIPITNFHGQLVLESTFQEDNIAPFIQYLGALPNIHLNQDLIEEIALDQLVFKSNIPIGYGAGSSGALTAAVYDAFVVKHDGMLQEALASMEDFFHGSSSGLDPLVSYRREPTLPIDKRGIDHFYLLDTGVSRKTAPLVEIFKKKAEHHSFEVLAGLNRKTIKAMKDYDLLTLSQVILEISHYQFEHFQEMIPAGFKDIWKASLNEDGLSIKLCGAGGGGFLLLFSMEERIARAFCEEHDVKWVKIEC